MPFDVPATVIANTRLSHDYNVLALAAPQALTPGRMKELLQRELRSFAVVQDDPFAFEVGGSMGVVVATTATWERRVAALHEQHRRLGRHAERILRDAPEPQPP